MVSKKSHRTVSRRKVLASASSAAILAGLAGCSGDGGNEGGGEGQGGDETATEGGMTTSRPSGQTVELMTHLSSEGEQQVFESVKENFEEETPHTLQMRYVGAGSDQAQSLARRIRAGNPPELNLTGFSEPASFLGQDVFLSLEDLRSDIESRLGTVSDNLWINENDGTLVGIPFMQNAHNVTVRKDLVEQVGYTFPEDTEGRLNVSWEDNLEWIRAIDEQTDVRGWALPYGNSGKSQNDMMSILWTHGVEIWQGQTGEVEVTLDKEPNRSKAITATENVLEAMETGPDAAGWDWGEVSAAFGPGSVSEATYSIGRMLQATRESNEEHWNDVVPIAPPFLDSRSDGTRVTGAVNGFMAFKDAESPDAALEFLKFWYDSPEVVNLTLAAPFHYWPSFPEHQESDTYLENEVIQSRPDVREFQQEVRQYVSARNMTAQGGFNPYTGGGEGLLGGWIGRVRSQGMDPEDAIDATAADLRSIRE